MDNTRGKVNIVIFSGKSQPQPHISQGCSRGYVSSKRKKLVTFTICWIGLVGTVVIEIVHLENITDFVWERSRTSCC